MESSQKYQTRDNLKEIKLILQDYRYYKYLKNYTAFFDFSVGVSGKQLWDTKNAWEDWYSRWWMDDDCVSVYFYHQQIPAYVEL